MSAHTPGPWEASLVSNELGEVFVYSTLQRRVAQSLGAFAIGADEARANARLIAAAPDLLAALKPVADPVREVSRDERPVATVHIELFVHELEAIRAAIAKAGAA